jgi:hypothetical protein
MSTGVEFDEDKISYGAPRQQTYSAPPASGGFGGQPGAMINHNDPKMVQWLMRKGIVKSPAAAQTLLILVVIINIALTYYIITSFL